MEPKPTTGCSGSAGQSDGSHWQTLVKGKTDGGDDREGQKDLHGVWELVISHRGLSTSGSTSQEDAHGDVGGIRGSRNTRWLQPSRVSNMLIAIENKEMLGDFGSTGNTGTSDQ